jgi:predicted amidohydrolase
MRLAIAQRNPTVGDLDGNARLVREAVAAATRAGADALLLSELFLSGYPPKDLLWQEGFLEALVDVAKGLAAESGPLALLLGSPWPAIEDDPRRDIRNSVLVIRNGRIETRYDKRLLPNYDVFDEQRWFRPGNAPCVIDIAGRRVGVAICEDMWRAEDARCSSRYENDPDPLVELTDAGAQCVLVPSASPFGIDKWKRQHDLLLRHAAEMRVPFVAVNELGATDDLVFDGMAAVLAPNGDGAHMIAVGKPFEEDLVVVDPFDTNAPKITDPLEEMPEPEVVFRALRLGLRDYVRKTGHQRLVIGLSGGIDSAVAACLGVSAVGAVNVLGVGMPSRFSSEGSQIDARELAANLGMPFVVSPISDMHGAADSTLREDVADVGAAIRQLDLQLTRVLPIAADLSDVSGVFEA